MIIFVVIAMMVIGFMMMQSISEFLNKELIWIEKIFIKVQLN